MFYELLLIVWKHPDENENESDTNARPRLVEQAWAYSAWRIQPIDAVHFYRSRFRSRYRGLCERPILPTKNIVTDATN